MSENKSETKKLDITSTAIEKGLDLVKDFLQKFAGPAAEELGLYVSDNIRLWRFKNQLNILEKARVYVAEKGIDVKGISPKILAPLLEGASLEEDKSLQDMWTALLVNYIDSSKNYTSNVFPYILSQLSSVEAKILEFISQETVVDGPFLNTIFNIDNAEVSNLIRLGLIFETEHRVKVLTSFGESHGNVIFSDRYSITSLGHLFIVACKLKEEVATT